jgi:subtilisin family serine protease
MKRLKYIIVLANMTMALLAQSDFFYAPNGEKVSFKIRKDRIVLKVKSGESVQKLQNQALFSSLAGLDGVRHMATVDMRKDCLEELRQNPVVTDASFMLEYEDGTLQALTDQIFVQPKEGVSIKLCMEKTGLTKQLKSAELIIPEDGIYLLTLDVKSGEILSVVRKLHETGLCGFAEPCFIKLIKPRNALYSQQWGLKNTGQNGGVVGMDVRAEAAWNQTRGSNIKVAVIDEGVELTHPDLQANLLTGYDATTGASQGANGSPNSWDAHGTMCAGIIAAVNNTIGIVGVASSAKVVPIRKAFHANNTSAHWTSNDSWTIDAFNYARSTAQADVISCSWNGGSVSSSVTSAINNAALNGRNGKGCVVVFAAGNDSVSTILYPANLPNVIAVGAIQTNGTRSVFSNYGSDLDVVAPGATIISTDITGTGGYNTSSGTAGDYASRSGTSLACPHVAGIAALILAVNSDLTRIQVKNIIESTARKVGGYTYSSGYSHGTWNTEMGYGLVDAEMSVLRAFPVSFSGPSLLCSGSSGTFTVANAPSGYTWTQSSNLNSPSISGNTAIFTAKSGSTYIGPGWVAINVGTAEVARYDIWVGTPVISNITGPTSHPNGQWATYQAIIPSLANPTSYQWTLSPLNGNSVYNYGNVCDIAFYNSGSYQVVCRATNACGQGAYYVIDVEVYNASSYSSVYPNPVSDILHIDINREVLARTQVARQKEGTVSVGQDVSLDIRLYDSQGNQQSQAISKGENAIFDVSRLSDGIYYLHVHDGIAEKPEIYKVIVKH